jgi:hypothetical protein
MPGQYVGISDDAGNKLTVNTNGTISTITGADPSIKGVYVFALADAAGVVAANNFMSLLNPVGSGRNISFSFSSTASYVATTAIVAASMGLYRITTATGGVDSSATIAKLATAYSAPVGVVRTGNPTVTLGNLLNTVAPPLSAGSFTSGDAITINASSVANTLILAPGEGIAFRTTSGDVNQRWNLTIAWAEI